MEYIVFILIICIVILFINYNNLKKDTHFIKSILEKYSSETSILKKEIAELKKSIEDKTFLQDVVYKPIEEIKPIENEINPNPIEEIIPIETEVIQEIIIEDSSLQFNPIEEIVQENTIPIQENIFEETTEIEKPITTYESQSSPKPEPQKPIVEKVYEESAFSKILKNAEKQFADNWTGILGTAIMVLGIGYLSIYTALKVNPLFRVLILWLYAGLLVGTYYFLQKKEKWTTTGLWLRSAGASLFLFGCYGASQVPALTFISNTLAGYALIGVGIALNLYIGYIIKKQTFLSLHVILSMLILCVIPEKTLATFVLASITATIGIVLSYKEKWEYHLLIVISAFLIFDIWFNVQGAKLLPIENIFAILGIISVAASCMFMQYRKVYENTVFDKTAFITHLFNWVLFATGLILHSTGSRFKTFVLFIGAIICLFIALKARKRKIVWLYHLDGMVSFILLSLSIIMLNDWNVGIDIIACILYLLVLVCLFVVYQNKETLLYKIFHVINHVLGVGLILFLPMMTSISIDSSQITSALATSIILSISAISVPIISAIKNQFDTIDFFFGERNLSLNGLLSIVFSIFIILNSNDFLTHHLFIIVVFGIALIWCFLEQKFQKITFDLGRIVFYILSIILGLLIINSKEKFNFDLIYSFGLLAVIIYNWKRNLFIKNQFVIRFLAIIGTNALLLLLTYKHLSHYHVVQIFSLFGIALLNHEFLWTNFKKKNINTEHQTILYLFYFFFSIIGSLLFLKYSTSFSNTKIGLICLAISAIQIYVLFAKRIKNHSEETTKEWTNFNLINSEFIIFNALVFGFSCLQNNYLSVYFGVLALLTFIASQKFNEFKRYTTYSFLLVVGSVILSIYFAIYNIETINKTQIYITQVISIALSIGYSYLQMKSNEENGKKFASILPFIQNSWVIILLFIQVETNYLPLFFLLLALLNYWLISKEKIKITIASVPIIAFLAILVSVIYSFTKLNNFTAIDWIIQLGSVALGLFLSILLNKKEENETIKSYYQIVLNCWLSLIMFSQLPHKWLPVFWAATAILNLYLYYRKISKEKNISIVYYLLANLHLAFLSFSYFESKFLAIYLLIFALLAVYIYLAYKWMEDFKLKNSLLIYTATLSIGCFLYLTFDKGILTFFWILEALGLLILGILLKEKYFRFVSLSLVGVCVFRLMFFDLSNADFLIRALVLLGVGVVLLVMNSLFKKYKDRFE